MSSDKTRQTDKVAHKDKSKKIFGLLFRPPMLFSNFLAHLEKIGQSGRNSEARYNPLKSNDWVGQIVWTSTFRVLRSLHSTVLAIHTSVTHFSGTLPSMHCMYRRFLASTGLLKKCRKTKTKHAQRFSRILSKLQIHVSLFCVLLW